MIVIHLARKPLAETSVARNTLKYGTGALNIDTSRIGNRKNVPASPSRALGVSLTGSLNGSLRNETGTEGGGRWPANIVLEHHPGCVRVGLKNVKATWECVPGCPARELDVQSGVITSGVPAYEGESNTGFLRGVSGPHNQYGDSGGVSRFFKQVQVYPDYRRASGRSVCSTCGKLFFDHPKDHYLLGYGDIPYLNVLCTGERVKL